MRRRTVNQITGAAKSTLVEGEQVLEYGHCWAAQRRDRLPLVFAGRRQYLMVLTDRRLLLFARRSGQVRAGDLVIGKRYETFTLERTRRARPLLQLRVQASNGTRMVFEFRPGRRHVGEALVHRLDPRPVAALNAPAGPAEPVEQLSGDDAAFWGASAPRS